MVLLSSIITLSRATSLGTLRPILGLMRHGCFVRMTFPLLRLCRQLSVWCFLVWTLLCIR